MSIHLAKGAKFLKRSLLNMSLIIVGAIGAIVALTVFSAITGYPIFGGVVDQPKPTTEANNEELTSLSYTVLGYIKNGDYNALSQIAHPEFGVVFSPDATVALTTNKCFQADQIAAFGSDNTVYVWGIQSGVGEPIEMTAADYLAEYVFSKDYLSAPLIGVNRIVKSGNALENITDVFPKVKFVDFHIPGSERDSAEDFGWTSLRLGFEEYEGRLWLTLILTSKWTG